MASKFFSSCCNFSSSRGDDAESELLMANEVDGDRSHEEGHEGGTSDLGAIYNFVCTTLGAGILSLPAALYYAGWSGVFILMFLGLISNYTAKLLIKCMHSTDKPLTSYEDIGHACFGRMGRIVVTAFVFLQLYGVGIIFLILIGLNIQSLINSCLTYHDYTIIFALVVLPATYLKTMKEVSSVALFGLIASLIVAVVVILVGTYTAVKNIDTPVPGLTHHFFPQTFSDVVNSFNTAVFSFGVHAILPTLENTMASKKSFPFVSNLSFFIITEVYTLVALAGYAGWGTTINPSDTILTNLEGTYGKHGFLGVLQTVTTVIITIHIILAFPLPMNPVNLILEKAFKFDRLEGKKELIPRIILRTCVVFLAVFIANIIPFFGSVLNLVSALAGISVAFLLPVIFYLKLNYHKGEIPKWEFGVMAIVIIVGLLGMVVGLYLTISNFQFSGFENYFWDCPNSS